MPPICRIPCPARRYSSADKKSSWREKGDMRPRKTAQRACPTSDWLGCSEKAAFTWPTLRAVRACDVRNWVASADVSGPSDSSIRCSSSALARTRRAISPLPAAPHSRTGTDSSTGLSRILNYKGYEKYCSLQGEHKVLPFLPAAPRPLLDT
jgi:hypothetical protein